MVQKAKIEKKKKKGISNVIEGKDQKKDQKKRRRKRRKKE